MVCRIPDYGSPEMISLVYIFSCCFKKEPYDTYTLLLHDF